LRQAVRQSLLKDSGPEARLEVHLEWLSLGDLSAGKIRQVKIQGYQCRIGGIELQQLRIDSSGLILNLPMLLKEKQFVLQAISRMRLVAFITETAATEYQEFQPRIAFFEDRLQVTGKTEVLGKIVPLQLEGLVRITPPKTLRFYPKQLQVANHSISANFLKYLSDRIPLETEVLRIWPLQVTALTLKPGIVVLKLREMAI
jgi:hypothetical protein